MRYAAVAQLATFSTLLDPSFDFYKLAEFHDGNRYTLHGSWPTRTDGTWPEFCAGTPFDAIALAPLEPRLEQDWPNYWGSSLALHRHEYNRHGKCSGLTEVQYFNRTLGAYESFSLNTLVPRSRTPPHWKDLSRLFYQRYGVWPVVDRVKHGRAAEVSYCLNKQWKLIECPKAESATVTV